MLTYSVIVPHHNDVHGLALCVQSLLDQTVPRAQYEIIVVDNNSSQSVRERIRRQFGRSVILKNELRQGAAHARNCGIASAQGTKILFTDSDCVVSGDWIERLGKSLDGNDICGGRIIVTAAAQGERSAVEWFEIIFAFDQKRYVTMNNFSATANLGAKRKVVELVGGFREGLSEDVDWCWRAVENGYLISYDEAAIVYHPARRTIGELCAKWRRITVQDLALRQSRGTTRLHLLARQVGIALSPFVHMFRVLSAPGIPTGARLGVVAVLFYIRGYRALYGVRRLITKPSPGGVRSG